MRTLWELVQLTSPVLALRSRAIRDIVLWITKRMGIKDPWQYELAATLCLVGCIALPDEVFERAYCGQDLSPDEDRMFRAHPERAARLLSNIPRLEVVAEIIRGQQGPEANPSRTGDTRRSDAPFGIGIGPKNLPGSHSARRAGRTQVRRADSTAACWMRSTGYSPAAGGVRSAAAADSRASRGYGSRRMMF